MKGSIKREGKLALQGIGSMQEDLTHIGHLAREALSNTRYPELVNILTEKSCGHVRGPLVPATQKGSDTIRLAEILLACQLLTGTRSALKEIPQKGEVAA